MRLSCYICVLKHLEQASINMDEAALGYPRRKWRAIGQMAEAESESLDKAPLLAHRIREYRLEYTNGKSIYLEEVIDEVIDLMEADDETDNTDTSNEEQGT